MSVTHTVHALKVVDIHICGTVDRNICSSTPPCCVSFRPVSLTSACERCETGQCRLVSQLQGPSRKTHAQVFLAFVPPPLIS